ncbi:MAG: arsenate reductase ArsC [Candidatus Heimdallarchaeota archaeon]
MKRIYFLCIGNTSRSQMAEGFAKHFSKGLVEVKSGGTKPASKVSSKALMVMKEIGIDISNHYPKKMDIEFAKQSDLVIIMGCGAEKMCPAWVVSKSENWDLEDTQDQEIDFYRKIRDSIKTHVLELLESITKEK